MEDSGTDSRMQTRECSGLHDRGKDAKMPERPIKARSGAYHGIFTSFPAFHSLHSPLCASFQDPESPVKLPVKIRIKIPNTLLTRKIKKNSPHPQIRRPSRPIYRANRNGNHNAHMPINS